MSARDAFLVQSPNVVYCTVKVIAEAVADCEP